MDEDNSMVETQTSCLIPDPSGNESVDCTCQHNGRQILDELLPLNVDETFNVCFNGSKIYFDFQAHRKNCDIVQTPWSDDPSGKGKTRVVSLTAYTNQSFLPKTSKVNEMQTIHPCSRAGVLYSMTGETTLKGPPMADSFIIEMHYCLKKVSEKQTSISVYAQIKYKKAVFGLMKGMIEKMSLSGLEEFWKEFCIVIRADYDERVPDANKTIQRNNSKRITFNENISFLPDNNETPTKLEEKACTGLTVFIFGAIFFLAILNVFLYNKLLSLEGIHQSQDVLRLQLLKNAPAPSDELINSLLMQNSMQSDEMKKWHDSLKETIHSLKEAENILSSLKQWTDARLVNKIDSENDQSDPNTSGRTSQEL